MAQPQSKQNARVAPLAAQMRLSPTGIKYINALCDPKHAEPVGVPDQLPLPTRKLRVWAAGTFYTSSTTGVGYVAVAPRAMAANDSNPIAYSSASFTGTAFSASGTGVNVAQSNSEYASAVFTDANADANASFRLVGCVLTVQYTGTELNCGGTAYMLHDPTHSSVIGRDAASLNQELQTHRHAITTKRDKLNVIYTPALGGETGFFSTMSPAFGGLYMGVLIEAPSNTPLSFRYEVYAIIEVQGADARGQTHGVSNPMDFAAVQNATKMSSGVHVGEPSIASQLYQSVANEFRAGAANFTRDLGKKIGSSAFALFRTALL